MTIDLWLLVATAILLPTLTIPVTFGRSRTKAGLQWGLGNRDTPYDVEPWVARANRAHLNLLENLPTFAALILVAHAAGKAGAFTVLGAEIFFAARVAHAAVYLAGWTVIRTAVFILSLAGELLILGDLIR